MHSTLKSDECKVSIVHTLLSHMILEDTATQLVLRLCFKVIYRLSSPMKTSKTRSQNKEGQVIRIKGTSKDFPVMR